MAEEAATLNTAEQSSGAAPPLQDGELKSTIQPSLDADQETTQPGDSSSSDAGDEDKSGLKADADKADETDEAKGAGDDKSEGDRFDQHPRFIELNTRMKAAEKMAAQAETRAANLSRQLEETVLRTQPAEKKDLPYKDTSTMTDDQLRDWMDDNPREFRENMMAEAMFKVEEKLSNKLSTDIDTRTYEKRVEGTYESFAKDNPDFDEMWDKGEIKNYMDRNPGHNAISAYHMLTGEVKMQAAIDEAVQKATKETEDRMRKDFATRRSQQVLNEGPGGAGRPQQDETLDLKNSKAAGGMTALLTKRSLKRTQG
jgi:hypothetical protein